MYNEKLLTPAQPKQRMSSKTEGQQRRIERARKGGLATKAKYGREHYSALGKLGGRPTWQEALEKAKALEVELQSHRGKPGRPRTSHPATGERKELTAPGGLPGPIIPTDENPAIGAGRALESQQVS